MEIQIRSNNTAFIRTTLRQLDKTQTFDLNSQRGRSLDLNNFPATYDIYLHLHTTIKSRTLQPQLRRNKAINIFHCRRETQLTDRRTKRYTCRAI